MPESAKNILLVSTEAPEISIAQLEGGRVTDFYVERGGRLLNNIYKGRVANVINGMDAAFVDIGLARNALIYAGDVENDTGAKPKTEISRLLKVGDELTVQIARPPVGTKGARVTTRLSLAGRFIVLSSQEQNSGVSRRIESEEDRSRLRRLADKLRPLDHGLIIRTEAEGASDNELNKDIHSVTALMKRIRQKAVQIQAPGLVHREAGLLGRVVRDSFNEKVHEVWIDSPDEYESFVSLAQEITPHLINRIHLYESEQPLFHRFAIHDDLAKAQERVVQMPRGGSLFIDETEALCAIDINTGKYTGKSRLADTVLQTNLDAVDEAARQIRLRNLGGVIVIDFIDMERQRDRVRVLDALEAALKKDPNRTRIVQLSPSGLVEITRRRESHSLRQVLTRPCSYCEGSGVIKSPATVAIEVRRKIRQLARENPQVKEADQLVAVTLHPDVACAFLGPANEFTRQLEESLGVKVWLRADPGFHQQADDVEVIHINHPGNVPLSTPRIDERLCFKVQTALYPAKEPQFVVHDNRLIQLDNMKNLQQRLPEIASGTFEVRITATGRWYNSGEVVDLPQA